MTLEELLALAERATPGPWHVDYKDYVDGMDLRDRIIRMPHPESGLYSNYALSTPEGVTADATHEMIAACSPEVVKALIQYVLEATFWEGDSPQLHKAGKKLRALLGANDRKIPQPGDSSVASKQVDNSPNAGEVREPPSVSTTHGAEQRDGGERPASDDSYEMTRDRLHALLRTLMSEHDCDSWLPTCKHCDRKQEARAKLLVWFDSKSTALALANEHRQRLINERRIDLRFAWANGFSSGVNPEKTQRDNPYICKEPHEWDGEPASDAPLTCLRCGERTP